MDHHINPEERTPSATSVPDDPITERVITLETRDKIKSECAYCKTCGSHPNKPCGWSTPCPMHAKIQAEMDQIDQIIKECGVEWDSHKHLELLKL